jgi:hypothetical protein
MTAAIELVGHGDAVHRMQIINLLIDASATGLAAEAAGLESSRPARIAFGNLSR